MDINGKTKQQGNISSKQTKPSTQSKRPISNSTIGAPPTSHKPQTNPTRETWKAAKEVDALSKQLDELNNSARKALELPKSAALKDPEKNKMNITLDWDMRPKQRSQYWAKINSDNGITRAEVWGTKSGKARTYLGSFNDESDVDGLNKEGQEQLQKALYITRQIITGKAKFASADDSASESGSDTSEEDK